MTGGVGKNVEKHCSKTNHLPLHSTF